MTIREMQNEILRLKKEHNICILAHVYQSQEILEIADFYGDSFGLSQKAAQAPQNTILMCGVRFMAETVKILSPQKRVLLSHPDAGCPMADQIDGATMQQLRKRYPEHTVVAYINTTAELKTMVDVCVTSSSTVKIIENIENEKILFIPDCNLGDWVAKQLPHKSIELVRGGCPTHLRMNTRDVEKARAAHPNAKLLVHPECHPSVVAAADYVGSTTGIINYATTSAETEFIIGTDNSITTHLQFSCTDKKFYPLSMDCVCHNMRITSLFDVLSCLKGQGGDEIFLDSQTQKAAKRSIDEMLRLGG